MIKISYFLILIGILSIFGGCSTSQPLTTAKEPKTLPSWYLNPPSNSSEYLYGVGEGKDLDEAQKNALDSMVSQLGISISSNYESNINVHKSHREYFTKQTSFSLKSEVSKIRISNYEVMQTQEHRYNRLLVLVRSNKKLFTLALKKELRQKLQRVEQKALALRLSDPLSRYKFYERSMAELQEISSTVLVLDALDNRSDDKAYINVLQSVSSAFEALKKDMSFSLVCDGSSTAFKDELQVALTAQNRRITQKYKKSKDHISIILHTDTNYARSNGFDIARTVLHIEVKDNYNKVIGGNRIALVGHATAGKEVALNNAVKKLHELIDKEGISRVLGI